MQQQIQRSSTVSSAPTWDMDIKEPLHCARFQASAVV